MNEHALERARCEKAWGLDADQRQGVDLFGCRRGDAVAPNNMSALERRRYANGRCHGFVEAKRQRSGSAACRSVKFALEAVPFRVYGCESGEFNQKFGTAMKKAIVAALVLAASALTVEPARAFEEANCERLTEVQPADIQEPLQSASDYPAARERAIQRASQDAIAQVVGFSVQTSRENRIEMNNDQALQRFRQLDKSDMSGFVRPRVVAEKLASLGKSDAISMQISVVVCVPKAEYLQMVAQEKALRERKPPVEVDAHNMAWFDAKTGAAMLWYWKGGSRYEFFDNEGFHPKNGSKLQPVTAKLFEEWTTAEEKKAQAEKDRAEKARRMAEQAAERQRKEAELAARMEAQRAAEEIERQRRLANAPENCDRLAANPTDPMKPASVMGATADVLKANAEQAIEACAAAAEKLPQEPRYRYQLARAVQISDPNKALPTLRALMSERYPAAHDNYGWALLDARTHLNDLAGAVAAFRKGADLGDPDSMDSLANLIMQGKAPPRGGDEHMRLLQRAAGMGHLPAQARLVRVQEENSRRQQQQIQEEQARQMFLGIMGGVVQGMQRR